MDLVDDNEFSGLCPQERVRIVQTSLIDRSLEIQVDSRGFGFSRSDGAIPEI